MIWKEFNPPTENICSAGLCAAALLGVAPHVLKGMRLAPSDRLGDHMLPPELMGRLGRRHSEYSDHPKKMFALPGNVQRHCNFHRKVIQPHSKSSAFRFASPRGVSESRQNGQPSISLDAI